LPSVADVRQSSHAQELFRLAVSRATVIDTALSGLHSIIKEKSPKHEELIVARTQVVRKVSDDSVFALTRDAIRGHNEEIPTVLLEAETLQKDPQDKRFRSQPFRLDGRQYGGPNGTILRLLYLASEGYPLPYDSVVAL